MTKIAVKDLIYYTGDMANASGWFRVARVNDRRQDVDLCEVDGIRVILSISHAQIGDVYEGHCGTRFVTENAYKAYRAKITAEYEKMSAKFVRIGAAS